MAITRFITDNIGRTAASHSDGPVQYSPDPEMNSVCSLIGGGEATKWGCDVGTIVGGGIVTISGGDYGTKLTLSDTVSGLVIGDTIDIDVDIVSLGVGVHFEIWVGTSSGVNKVADYSSIGIQGRVSHTLVPADTDGYITGWKNQGTGDAVISSISITRR